MISVDIRVLAQETERHNDVMRCVINGWLSGERGANLDVKFQCVALDP